MEFQTLKAILDCGDKYGSAIKQMLKDLEADNLTTVTQEQAELWLKRKGENNDK